MVMVIGVKDNFQQYSNYILAVSIISGSMQDYFPNITRVKYYFTLNKRRIKALREKRKLTQTRLCKYNLFNNFKYSLNTIYLQTNGGKRRTEHRIDAEIVADITRWNSERKDT
jgi:hypothetical protein